ncbi:MAG: UvrD-helicase domain-containing protein [Armatimonadetes bacterium]|nr:UvrD-helicase domain-containing protein [Armatimonadota bacterium]
MNIKKNLNVRSRNLCAVGDDDQSIYKFRGADVSIILKFENDFPDSKIIKLEENYRSSGKILEAANSLVKNNLFRKEKKLWTRKEEGKNIVSHLASNEREEAHFIAKIVRNLIKEKQYKLGEMAILYRINAQSRILEEVFLQSGIPHKIVGGVRFYDRKEIKDILAYLKALLNPSDEISLKRIINVPPRGIGQAALREINAYSKDNSLWDILNKYGLEESNLYNMEDKKNSPKIKNKIKEFVLLINNLKTYLNQPLTILIEKIINQSGYKNYLEKEQTSESLSRIENLEELISVALEFEKKEPDSSLADFLAQVSLLTNLDTFQEDKGALNLMTLHQAKGLEFKVVFIAGLEEGILPHSRSLFEEKELEEERRLCYVGITRAAEELYITRAMERTIFGVTLSRESSRFLREIQDNLIELPIENLNNAPDTPISSLKIPPQTDFNLGDLINHHLWGRGEIIELTEEGIKVKFPEIGEKLIGRNFLKLKKEPKIKIGERIQHHEFGSGIILELKEERKIKAVFPLFGMKIIEMTKE